MEKLHYTIQINAPVQKVWDTMLQKDTYLQWTEPFNPGEGSTSRFEGNWEQGSSMRFIGADKDGNEGGMYAVIAENRPNEFLSIQHLGEIRDGQEVPWPDNGGSFYENYTFKEVDGGTELIIDLDTVDEYKDMFNDMWPKALQKLKELAEA